MIYFVRHGETDWNLFGKFTGETDVFLNKTGIEQSKLQAENLKNVKFDVCFCSPKTRAKQTCEIIFSGKIIFDERLTEINCGEFEGLDETAENIKLFFQAASAKAETETMGTENFNCFVKRNCDFCDMITKEYINKNVLIVAHAANTRIINYYFTGKPKDYDFTKAVSTKGGLLMFENS